jgi:cobaltochelatase CobS
MNEQERIDGKTYTDFSLQALTKEECKKLALQAHTERGSMVDRSWLGARASKQDLIDFCLSRARDYGYSSQSVTVEGRRAESENGNAAVEQEPEAQLVQSILALASKAKSNLVDQDRVEQICNDLLDIERAHTETLISEAEQRLAGQTKRLEISVGDTVLASVEGLRHKEFDELLADCLAFKSAGKIDKCNFWLVGEAGTGKTTCAEMIAKHLGLEFRYNGAIDSEYKLRGFIDANGNIISTPFREAYTQGGVYLFDEVDSSLPSACLAFNAALANGSYDFPGVNKPIKRNENCLIFAASNTWNGPCGSYVGRFKQDAAFQDRFIRVEWETDEQLEGALCSNPDWHAFVVKCRANVHKHGMEHLISPRATINGDVMLQAGRSWDRVVKMCVRKGLSDSDWAKVIGRGN